MSNRGKSLDTITEETRLKVLEARRRALPFGMIAENLGVTEEQARQAFTDALERERAEFDIDLATQLDLSRIDRMIQGSFGNATSGDPRAVDSMLKMMDARRRLLGGPVTTVTADAFDATVEALALTAADSALIGVGRRLCQRIDAAAGAFDPEAETKAMYLIPHVVNILAALGATPAARASVKTAREEQGGKLAQLRALRAQEGEAARTA